MNENLPIAAATAMLVQKILTHTIRSIIVVYSALLVEPFINHVICKKVLPDMNNHPLSHGELLRMAMVRYVGAILVLSAMFFLPAGTLNYWQAWVYLAILFIPMLFVLSYLLRNDPDLLERRFRMHEKESAQRKIIGFSWVFFLAAFLLPGFDQRFGWSQVPVWVVISADVLVLLGYGIVFLVFRQNTYASRVVEVEEKQQVISSGVYAIVRHPMYLGSILLYAASPMALGSWWALFPIIPIIGILVARIMDEERLLRRDLPGYEAYTHQVHYRLIPGIW